MWSCIIFFFLLKHCECQTKVHLYEINYLIIGFFLILSQKVLISFKENIYYGTFNLMLLNFKFCLWLLLLTLSLKSNTANWKWGQKSHSSEYIQILMLQTKTVKMKIMNTFISVSLTVTIILKDILIFWFL